MRDDNDDYNLTACTRYARVLVDVDFGPTKTRRSEARPLVLSTKGKADHPLLYASHCPWSLGIWTAPAMTLFRSTKSIRFQSLMVKEIQLNDNN